MKKIAILHYSCPPVVGGVEEIVRQQTSLFLRHDHPVKVLAGRGERFHPAMSISINPLLDSNHPEIKTLQGNAKAHLPLLQKFSEKILDYLEEQLCGFQILIAHNVLTMPYNLPLTLALHTLAKKKPIRVVSWNHDSPYFYENHHAQLNEPPWNILRSYNRNIDYITISANRSQEFQKLYQLKKEIKVIEDGIDPFRFFRLDTLTVRLIREENLFDSDLLIVQPSRLHPRKNIEKSLTVLKAFHDLHINAKLLLTGSLDPHEASSRAYYKKLIGLAEELQVKENLIVVSDHVFKNGDRIAADRVMIRDLYLIADLLFLPSRQEGFGIPLLEAGMIKLPIACSDIPPFKSIAHDAVIYFNADEDPPVIAKRIGNFLSGLLPHRMFRTVIRHYVWDNIYQNSLKDFLNQD